MMDAVTLLKDDRQKVKDLFRQFEKVGVPTATSRSPRKRCTS
jgi:hypothetical protein